VTLEATCDQDSSVLAEQVRTTATRSLIADDSPGPCPGVHGARVDPYPSVEDALAAGVELPCQVVDPDLFFAESPAEVELAKALCRDCPVRDVCLAAALARREPWGVWGGEWFVAGEAVGHKRPRGRPRKEADAAPGLGRPALPASPSKRKEVAA